MSLTPAYVLLCGGDDCGARMVFVAVGTHPESAQITARNYGWTITDATNECPNCAAGRAPVPAPCSYCGAPIAYDGHRQDRCTCCGAEAAKTP